MCAVSSLSAPLKRLFSTQLGVKDNTDELESSLLFTGPQVLEAEKNRQTWLGDGLKGLV